MLYTNPNSFSTTNLPTNVHASPISHLQSQTFLNNSLFAKMNSYQMEPLNPNSNDDTKLNQKSHSAKQNELRKLQTDTSLGQSPVSYAGTEESTERSNFTEGEDESELQTPQKKLKTDANSAVAIEGKVENNNKEITPFDSAMANEDNKLQEEKEENKEKVENEEKKIEEEPKKETEEDPFEYKDKGVFVSIDFDLPPRKPKKKPVVVEEVPVVEEVVEEEVPMVIDDETEITFDSSSINKPTSYMKEDSFIVSAKDFEAIKQAADGLIEADIQRLDSRDVYLNDNLINFYLKFIEFGLLSETRRSKMNFFNTYFFAKMLQLFNGEANKEMEQFDIVYEGMKKWTRRLKFFEKDFLFIPINENEHWNLAILCNPAKLFSNDNELPYVIYLDSFCRMDTIYSTMLFEYIKREVQAKLPDQVEAMNQKINAFNLQGLPCYQHMVPKQSNGIDCGLFLLQFTEFFAQDESYITNNKEDMNKIHWFPRRLIGKKRKEMKKLIKDLKANKPEAVKEYLDRREIMITENQNKVDQFNSFNQKLYEKALKQTYPNKVFNDAEIWCLKLDYYFFETLDFDSLVAAKK